MNVKDYLKKFLKIKKTGVYSGLYRMRPYLPMVALRKFLTIKKIVLYKMSSFLSIIIGCALLTIGFAFFLALSGESFMNRFMLLLVFAPLSVQLIIFGLWTMLKAADLKINSEGYDKERELR